MDPISILTTLGSVIKYLYEQAEKTKENGEECARLASHADTVYKLIVAKGGNVAPSLAARLGRLFKYVIDYKGLFLRVTNYILAHCKTSQTRSRDYRLGRTSCASYGMEIFQTEFGRLIAVSTNQSKYSM